MVICVKKINILNEILEHKRKEVQARKKETSLDTIKNKLSSEIFHMRNFKKALKKNGRISIIAEIKKSSPSIGIIKANFDHILIAKEYDKANVDAISVLTDRRFFKGSLDFIREVKEVTNVPLLRKDFIIDSYQIYESKLYKADAILLIATVLTLRELKDYLRIAKELTMQCLVECHNKEEINKAISSGAEIIGINNRNLATFSVDVGRFSKLRKLIPKNVVVVSESGIKSSHDAAKIKADGADAILVGTSIIQSNNIAKKVEELRV
ncbi:indole-3-glycerol phosphate synthase TrpC [Candidatus Woesearchaeota archaeon]|nr:indole-3-glycerol phosphate synthase TrpC [Candidatus Woesearchaeota archaeon]